LRSICRLKGQESNTLQGLGLVIGLKGSGDGGDYLPTIRSLATAMQLMGNPIGSGGAAELKKAKNVALVMVTATIPPSGGRQGDTIDCVVSSVGAAKSLAGGRLMITPLVGPNPESRRVFATASGSLTIEDDAFPTTGRVHRGCRLEEDFFNAFHQDGRITLVLDENHVGFQMAGEVAALINKHFAMQVDSSDSSFGINSSDSSVGIAKAINAQNIVVAIPDQYRNYVVDFARQVLDLELREVPIQSKVVIDERSGCIVMGEEVEIGRAVVTHKNGLVIEVGGLAGEAEQNPAEWFPVDTEGRESPKLKSLIAALKAIHVSTEDMIDIVKCLESDGKIYAKVIVR
jgi:flagellar P-ring protein FlgI